MGYVNIVFFGWVFGLNKDEGCRGMAKIKIVESRILPIPTV